MKECIELFQRKEIEKIINKLPPKKFKKLFEVKLESLLTRANFGNEAIK